MKTKLIFLLSIFLLILSGIGYAVGNCDEDLTNMPCNMTISAIHTGTYNCPDDCFWLNTSGNFNLNDSTFYANDSDGTGSFILKSNNVVLDCNGAELRGNGSANSIGILSNYNNVTITNCKFKSYPIDIRTGNSGDNNLIYNCQFNDSLYGVKTQYTSDNLTIVNNTFYNSSVYLSDSIKSVVDNNFFDGKSFNYTIGLSSCIRLGGVDYANITNNNCTNTTFGGIYLYDDGSNSNNNILIKGNYLYRNDKAIKINGAGEYNSDNRNISIISNTFRNNNANYDSYDVDIFLRDSRNINIFNNYFYEIGTTAILLSNCSSLNNISNNYFDFIPQIDRPLYDGDDREEIPSAIMIKTTYKGYTLDNSELSTDTISKLNQYVSSGVYISGNTFDSDTIAYLALEGATNITHDLSNYWYRAFQPATYLFPKREYYFSNQVTEIKNYFQFNDHYGLPNISNQMFIGYMTGGWIHPNRKFNYSISQNRMMFVNINQTTSYNLSLFNLTSLSYPYSQVFNGTSITPQCENSIECNVTLSPNNRSLVFQRATDNAPHPTSIATTILDMTTSLTSKTYSVNCTGSGSHTHTDLDYLGRTIYVYHDGVLVTTLVNEVTYTAASCSSWVFTSSDRENFNTEVKPNLVNAYLAIASLMSLVIIVAMLGGIIYLIVQFKNGRIEFTFDNVKFYLYGGAILLMLAVFVILVIVIIISVGSNILPGG